MTDMNGVKGSEKQTNFHGPKLAIPNQQGVYKKSRRIAGSEKPFWIKLLTDYPD
jgi:hypothetical protein